MAENEYALISRDMTLVDRFWDKVDKRGLCECWNWTAGKRAGRYGNIRVGGKHGPMVASHRVSYALHKGDPSGFFVLHKCDNTLCVNPSHLFLGSQADNVADMIAKGRDRKASGTENGKAIFSEEDIRKIRSLASSGTRPKEIAKATGFPYSSVYNVISGKAYADVSGEIKHKTPSQLRPGRKPKPSRPARGVVLRQMTDDQAREAFRLAHDGKMTAKAIASRYGVSGALIYAIKHRRAYSWATEEV